ncbi:uncharacterized protein LOC133862576 isoform X2 [Alnus glutinosa]|uniref:uncharacterized protein LOC133862576 isoform X2 n=1 Tax=Alnus glutinosa TaxID=3517 RepID=UPI002D78B6B0|nr:uncharacterized protein LOC133862576 isoform X2 [Alnus glutinosa]
MATSSTSKEDQKVDVNQAGSTYSVDWDNHGWCYMLLRIVFFLWLGQDFLGSLVLVPHFGQLFGSLFATGMTRLGPFLLLFAVLLMEFAAQSSKEITQDVTHSSLPEELSPIRSATFWTIHHKDSSAQASKHCSK